MASDWLENNLEKGDVVVYSSKSSLTGMNLGEITTIDDNKIQIRLWCMTARFSGATYMPTKIVTLMRGTSAHNSVTRYFGKLPNRESI